MGNCLSKRNEIINDIISGSNTLDRKPVVPSDIKIWLYSDRLLHKPARASCLHLSINVTVLVTCKAFHTCAFPD